MWCLEAVRLEARIIGLNERIIELQRANSLDEILKIADLVYQLEAEAISHFGNCQVCAKNLSVQ